MKNKLGTFILAGTLVVSTATSGFAAALDFTNTVDSSKYTRLEVASSKAARLAIASNMSAYVVEGKDGNKYKLVDVQEQLGKGLTFDEAIEQGKLTPVDAPVEGELKVVEVSAINAKQIKVTFNTKVDKDSATTEANYVLDSTDLDSNSKFKLEEDGKTVTITLQNALVNDKAYTFKVKKDVILSEDKESKAPEFATGIFAKDTVKPKVKEAKYDEVKSKIAIEYSEPIKTADTAIVAQVNGKVVAVTKDTNDDSKFLVSLPSGVKAGDTVKLYISGAEDYADNRQEAYTTDITVTKDEVALEVVSVKQKYSSVFEVEFNKELKTDITANTSLVIVTKEGNPVTINSIAKDVDEDTKYYVDVDADELYKATETKADLKLVIGKGKIEDKIGNKNEAIEKTFVMNKDETKVAIKEVKISKDNKKITVEFDKDVKDATVALAKITTRVDATGAFAALDKDGVLKDNILTLEKNDSSAFGKGHHEFKIAKDAITDKDGNKNNELTFDLKVEEISVTADFEITTITAGSSTAGNNEVVITFSEEPAISSVKVGKNYKLNNVELKDEDIADVSFDSVNRGKVTLTLAEGLVKEDGPVEFTVQGIIAKEGSKELKEAKTETLNLFDNTKATATGFKVNGNEIEITFDEELAATKVNAIDKDNLASYFEIKVDGEALNLGTKGTDGTDGSEPAVSAELVGTNKNIIRIKLTPAVAATSSTDAEESNWDENAEITIKVLEGDITDSNGVVIKGGYFIK